MTQPDSASSVKRTSQYLVMRDGVKIAIDIHVPASFAAGEKVPTIIRQTRYLRNIEFRWPFKYFFETWFLDTQASARKLFIKEGYAWIDVDVRGSGASFGEWFSPWSPDMVKDGGEIIDWIVKQPWSNGMVGSLGISYDGTHAEFIATQKHPALKAIAPRFSSFDVYGDVTAPGGIVLDQFLAAWQYVNEAFDQNRPALFVNWWMSTLVKGKLDQTFTSKRLNKKIGNLMGALTCNLMKLVLKGVKPVDEDTDRKQLNAAVQGRLKNFNVHEQVQKINFRDDSSHTLAVTGVTVDHFSPHAFLDDLIASNVAVFSYSGWFDGAYARSAIKRHVGLNHSKHRLILGPWNHGGQLDINPTHGFKKSVHDHDLELLRFFDHHLKNLNNGLPEEKPIRYFTMGENLWKNSDTWPPAKTKNQSYYFSKNNLLIQSESPKEEMSADLSFDEYRYDPHASSGELNRWKTLLGMPPDYRNRINDAKKMLIYDSAPLEQDLEITGHPVVTIYASADAVDCHLFVYLEEVSPSGAVSCLTEGQLRAIQRNTVPDAISDRLKIPFRTFRRAQGAPLTPGKIEEFKFDLLPVSNLFKKGNSIRISIAMADSDNFASMNQATALRVFRSGEFRSRVDLPIQSKS